VVHGDRVEALAGAIVGALRNILVAHIEGGEISGTIDELIRHAVTKMSHVHFVANEDACRRLLQLERTCLMRSPLRHNMIPEQELLYLPELRSLT
jgi:UDP-N-acetylglucosamine 2-epimerase (hydrolysing)